MSADRPRPAGSGPNEAAPGPGPNEAAPGPRPARSGPDLARAALEAALAKGTRSGARRRGASADAGTEAQDGTDNEPGAGGAPGGRSRRRGYTGAGPDPRDPQPLAVVIAQLVRARGWQRPTAQATVFGAWEKVVGAEVAAHSRPVRLDAGELTVEAESTAWATQLRMLAANLLVRIAGEVGPNVVTKLHIHGPTAPSWQRGPLRVRGRGPRDTYG